MTIDFAELEEAAHMDAPGNQRQIILPKWAKSFTPIVTLHTALIWSKTNTRLSKHGNGSGVMKFITVCSPSF